MKIAIVSDIHGNLEALEALPRSDLDEIWCLGDLVDYGPRPREVIEWVSKNVMVAVRGNHDHAVGFDVDPRCSPAFGPLAASTKDYTLAILSEPERGFLRGLPIHREMNLESGQFIASTRFPVIHSLDTVPKCPRNGNKRWNASPRMCFWLGIPTLHLSAELAGR